MRRGWKEGGKGGRREGRQAEGRADEWWLCQGTGVARVAVHMTRHAYATRQCPNPLPVACLCRHYEFVPQQRDMYFVRTDPNDK